MSTELSALEQVIQDASLDESQKAELLGNLQPLRGLLETLAGSVGSIDTVDELRTLILKLVRLGKFVSMLTPTQVDDQLVAFGERLAANEKGLKMLLAVLQFLRPKLEAETADDGFSFAALSEHVNAAGLTA